MHNYAVFFARWYFSLFHLSLIVLLIRQLERLKIVGNLSVSFSGVREEEVNERQLLERSLGARVALLLVRAWGL